MVGTYTITETESASYYGREIKNAAKTKVGSNMYGRVYVPKEWIGKKVLCLLLEEPDE